MDYSRFDELTKALATSTTRRQALRHIGGLCAARPWPDCSGWP